MSDLIQQSVYNKSRKDKFLFVLTLPKAMKDISTGVHAQRSDDSVMPDTLQFSVYGAVLPEVKVEAGAVRYGGQAVQFSSHSRPAYPNITVQFAVDNRFNNYWVIWKWIDLLNDDRDAIFYKDKDMSPSDSMFKEYQGTATLYTLDEYNKKTMQFNYEGLVPVSLGSIDYSYQDADQIDTTFEFSFSKLTPILL